MARNRRLAAVRRALLTRRPGWGLATALALLGILLGWHQFTRATGLAGQALAEAARLGLDTGWLLLLLAATGLVLGLALSGPRRAAFPAALIVLAAALGLVGWRVLVSSTPAAPEPKNSGNIMVYTSDPKASVALSVSPAFTEAGETLEGYRWLDIVVQVRKSTEAPLWWAVMLGTDATFPPGELPLSGTMPQPRPDADPVGSTYFVGSEPAYFVNGLEWPTGAEPDGRARLGRTTVRPVVPGGSSIVFGNMPEGGGRLPAPSLVISMTIEVRTPLLQDVGEYLALSTPTLGSLSQMVAAIPDGRRDPYPVPPPWLVGPHGVDPRLQAMLSNHRWYEPEGLQVAFKFGRLTGVRQETGTAPVAPFRTEWQAKDRLKVEAAFSRPGEAAKNQRNVFLAGVLVSLAASFFVWALELLLGPRRDPVAGSGDGPRRHPNRRRR